jgi:hypothetical protein
LCCRGFVTTDWLGLWIAVRFTDYLVGLTLTVGVDYLWLHGRQDVHAANTGKQLAEACTTNMLSQDQFRD